MLLEAIIDRLEYCMISLKNEMISKSIITLSQWVKISADYLKYFYFSQKTGLYMSCKLSSYVSKGDNLHEKSKSGKNLTNLTSAEISPECGKGQPYINL